MAWVYDSGENGPNMVWQEDPIGTPPSPAPVSAPAASLTPQAAVMQGMLAQQQAAPPPPPPPAQTFQYTLTPQGSAMNGGATSVTAAPPAIAPSPAEAPAYSPPPPPPPPAPSSLPMMGVPGQSATPPSYTPGQKTLDPSILAHFQGGQGAGWNPNYQFGGSTFSPINSADEGNAAQGNFTPGGFNGVSASDGKPWYEGQQEYRYDKSGNFTGANTVGKSGDDWVTKYGWIPAAVMSGGALAGAFGAGAGAAGAGAMETASAGFGPAFEASVAGGAAGAGSAASVAAAASAAGETGILPSLPLMAAPELAPLPELYGASGLGAGTAAAGATGTMSSLPLMSTADTLGELPMMPAMAPTASLPGLPGTPPVPPGAPSGSPAPAPAPATPPTFNPAQDSQLANQQLNLPPNSTVPSVATPSATSGIDSVRQAITSALGQAGLTPQQAASLGLALNSMYGSSSTTPALGSGSGTTGGTPVSGSQQGDEAAAFLQKVMPFIRYNASNPTGSANWSKDASGNYTLNTQLNSANQGVYNDATSKLGQFTAGLDPNAKAPTLLDSAGGSYSSDLAKTIYDRTMGLQTNNIDEQQRKLDQRLAEQGFTPQNEGYSRAMNLYQDNLNEARQAAARDAQIQASTQGLAEANFTNSSRTQGFKNSQDLQAQLAQILTGTRTNATEGLKTLTSQGSAPAGNPANTVAANTAQWTADLANQQRSDSTRNDLIRALMNWGLA